MFYKPYNILSKPFYYVISLLITAVLCAQEYPVKYLTISDGLSNNSVTSIYQDKKGYIWFGTYDGLNRYDGYEFKVFRNDLGDENSISANYVFGIEGDGQDNLWISVTNGGSVYNAVTGNFSRLYSETGNNRNPALLQENINQIKYVRKGLMLAACQKSGLIQFRGNSHIGKKVILMHLGKQVTQYNVTAIELSQSGDFCWVFIKNYGLYKYHIKTGQLQLISTGKKQVNIIKDDQKGRLWVGTDDGVFRFNTKTLAYCDNMLKNKRIVTNILRDKAGHFYIATDGYGVYKADQNGHLDLMASNGMHRLLKSDAVWGLYEDRDGNKWFGTLRGGISMVGSSKRYFTHIKDPGTSPNDNYILSFCEDKNNNVWIGTDGAGLHLWNRTTNTFSSVTEADGLTSNYIPGIVRDDNNNLWTATWNGGINKVNGHTKLVSHYRLYNTHTKREEKNAWLVYRDSDKKLWAATTREGTLYLLDEKDDRFKVYNPNLTDLLCLTETNDGKLWSGNYQDLICINKKNRSFTKKKIGYPIRCILEDRQQNLWIGTSEGGLLKYNRQNDSYIRYTTNDGLPSNVILRLLEDKNGNLWISTYNGLCRFDPENRMFRTFSVSDGLQSNQFSYNAGLALSTGEFLFGGINGFNVFNPDSIQDLNYTSRLLLADIHIDNIPIEKKQHFISASSQSIKELSLPYDQTTISLDFAALDYENADKINYAFYLKGWDKHWNYVGKNRNANYARLSEGLYAFKVKTTDTNGKWREASTLLIIKVLPPWYRTWWAYILYVLGTAGIVYAYIRYNKYKERMRYEVRLAHMENLKEKELAEKQVSMFTYIAHELRTPLSLIINPIKKVIKDQQDKGDPILDLSVAHRNSRRLLSLIDQLLLFRRAENDADELILSAVSLNHICDEVYQCFTQQARDNNITYTLLLPDNDVQIIGDYEKIEIALFNLVSNAFKYTPAYGSISVSLNETQETAYIAINDTGCGINDIEVKHIFDKFRQANVKSGQSKGFGIGLYLVKYFVEKHKGYVNCTSIPERGSEFVISFNKGYEHFADMPVSNDSVKMSELVKELLGENLYDVDVPAVVKAVNPVYDIAIKDELISEKKSILVIDDNTELRNYLITLFEEKYLVYDAADGIEGLKLAKKHFPDVILSDIAMEGMNGLELCRKVKETEGISHIPLILLTATTSQEVHLQGISEGADDYVTKPFDSDILIARVEALLKSRSHLRKYFLNSITLQENTYKVPEEYLDFLKKCIQLIELNLDNEDFTIKKFSKAMGMSHNGLYTKIKAISGQTLNGFIRSVRIRRAAVLMLTEDMNVAQAALQVGFEDKKYFREQFVKLFGMTPSVYIKSYRHSFNRELNIVQK